MQPQRKDSPTEVHEDIDINYEELLELFAVAPYGAYAVNMNQRIVFWNRAVEQILGYDAEEILGERCFRVLGGALEQHVPECAPRCSAVLWAQYGTVAPSYTTCVRTKNGTEKWITITHILLPAEQREHSVVVHVLYDITDQMEGKILLEKLGRYIANTAPLPEPTSPPVLERHDPGADSLTPREREVLALLCRGQGTKAIGGELFVSEATVRSHIQHLLDKLGVSNRLEAVTAAFQRGLV